MYFLTRDTIAAWIKFLSTQPCRQTLSEFRLGAWCRQTTSTRLAHTSGSLMRFGKVLLSQPAGICIVPRRGPVGFSYLVISLVLLPFTSQTTVKITVGASSTSVIWLFHLKYYLLHFISYKITLSTGVRVRLHENVLSIIKLCMSKTNLFGSYNRKIHDCRITFSVK